MIIFECLCFLDTQHLCIIEIKLSNVYAEVSKKKHYQWLLIDKCNQDVKELQFKSMDSSHEIEERFFDLGYLKFDSQKGIFISKEPSTMYPIDNNNIEEVPNAIMETVTRYLTGDNIAFL